MLAGYVRIFEKAGGKENEDVDSTQLLRAMISSSVFVLYLRNQF